MISDRELRGAKILVVDDLPSNIQLLEQILSEDGYTCVTSTMNPHEVRALHKQNRYDLILLDLQMPGLDGFEVMEGLQDLENESYLPILVISAQPKERIRALTSGAKDFISKPFDVLETRTRIRNMLEVRLLHKQLADANHELASLALKDPLTGLPNRRLLMDRLSLSIAHARRSHHAIAVVYLDLDDFKNINDSLGHDAGDASLRIVAARLTAAVREEDTVARIGGDEFVIAFWELNHADDVGKLVAKVIQAVAEPLGIKNHVLSMTASAGVSQYPGDGETAESLLASADAALYKAKRLGKNGFSVA
jgi:two-component system, cell cycle response regulator